MSVDEVLTDDTVVPYILIDQYLSVLEDFGKHTVNVSDMRTLIDQFRRPSQ